MSSFRCDCVIRCVIVNALEPIPPIFSLSFGQQEPKVKLTCLNTLLIKAHNMKLKLLFINDNTSIKSPIYCIAYRIPGFKPAIGQLNRYEK
uniref:Uncharacterized protein n=1 Tax=Brugia timori TaxID=42155 RepID=A0A0R3R5D6_9BILA